MGASRGFGGRVLYIEETTAGTTPTNPDFVKFSDYVQSVSIQVDPQTDEWRDIGDVDVALFTQGLESFGVRVQYLLHTGRKDILDGSLDRESDNSLKSYSIEVGLNLDGANPGYFSFTGAKCDEVSVSGDVGKPVMVEHTFRALAVARSGTEPSIGTGSRETAALGTVSEFKASSLTRGGSAVATITRHGEFRVSHALSVEGSDGSNSPVEIFEGGRSVSGRFDLSVDDGGVALADAVMNGDEADVVFNLGASGAPKVTLTDARWGNLDIPLGVQEAFVVTGVPFTAKGVTTGTVA